MEVQNLAKWISELQAQIDQVKRMAIAAAASGGDTVTITPALESGTKIADYTIGEDTSGSLYAPTPPIVPAVVSPFLDVANAGEETAFPSGAQLNYTATDDCAVILKMNIDANSAGKVLIGGVIVWSIYTTVNVSYRHVVYLKKGQVLTTLDLNTSAGNTYIVMPLEEATQPTPENASNRRRKK